MRIGTIGTGSIVERFLSAVRDVEGAQGEAVYSRKEDTGRTLANKFNIKKVYTDLDAMLEDDAIDFIYVASPNSLHYEHSLKALQKGKNVICEKPFTSTVEEAEALIKLAKGKNLMLFEAIITIHLPNYKLIKENIEKLGQLRMVQCNYSQYSSRYDQLLSGETPNVFSPKFSGGALQDINIYNLHFVMNMFGTPESISYTANKHPNGIDTSGVLVLKYPGFICECVGCKDTKGVNFVQIQGEKGYLYVHNGANGCDQFTVSAGDEETTINKHQIKSTIYYELMAFLQIYNNKDYKSCYDLLDYSHSVMKAVVAARKDADIVFEADTSVDKN
jgi:scyllo-inositol 2-dehydrogenase (NADP+)